MKARSPSSSTPKKRSRPPRERFTCAQLVEELRRLGTKRNVEGMARFGIVARKCFGVAKPELDALARRIGTDHLLALQLWNTRIQDAKILAGLVDDPKLVTAAQMERWVRDFENWDDCDGTCCHLFAYVSPAWEKAIEWTSRKREFQKRAGFALLAFLACHDKAASNAKFIRVLPLLLREAHDDRNFVRKAVNWALRNIGKRNLKLNRAAIRTAERMRELDVRSARWIAADALRELKSEAVQSRLRRKKA